MNTENLFAAIKKIEPEAHVAYHPAPGFYVVHVWGRTLSGEHDTREAAIADAHSRLYPAE